MARDNAHEQSIKAFADDFRGQVERVRGAVRGGDRPPFTEKINPGDLRDHLVAERVAADFERRGLLEQAAQARLKADRAQAPRGIGPGRGASGVDPVTATVRSMGLE